MADTEKRLWGIHTQDDSLFLKHEKIAIGWKEMGDLNAIDDSRDAFKSIYQEVYPDAKKGSVPTSAGMLYRFCHEVQVGDYVVYPSKGNRMINIGEITGDYEYDSSQHEYVHTRSVKWLKNLPRKAFSQGALYEIGSAMTFFAVKNYADDYLAALEKDFLFEISSAKDDPSVAATASQIIASTQVFILDELSRNLKGYPLEDLVDNLLKAMGYHTTQSAHGGDRGIDIIAYKDELPPRIVVQVKSQDSYIKEETLQSMKGAMAEGDYGFFVTLSDYTKNAKKYLENTPVIKGINGDQLVELILKYYNKLDDKYKKIIPLKMVYIPVSNDEE